MYVAAATPTLSTIATPTMWLVLAVGIAILLVLDFVLTRNPHEVSMREAISWSAFYIAIPVAFGGYLWAAFGSTIGIEYFTGYVVEKSLSVDNLFIFMLLLSGFAVPKILHQRVLLYGIIGALLMRGLFIALGAAALARFDWVFLIFGAILIGTAIKIIRDALKGQDHQVEVGNLRVVKLLRRWFAVTPEYHGTKLTVRVHTGRALTPFALVIAAILVTDLVFAVDSVPAIYGITGDPFLVAATNAFALLGLRSLYFVLAGALGKLRYLGHGLGVILLFIGAKLGLHWAHLQNSDIPDVPTLWSLGFILCVLTVTTAASLLNPSESRHAHEPTSSRS